MRRLPTDTFSTPLVDDITFHDNTVTLSFADGHSYDCDPVGSAWIDGIEQAIDDEEAVLADALLHAAVATWQHPEATNVDDAEAYVTQFVDALTALDMAVDPSHLARVLTVGHANRLSLGRIPTNTTAYPATFGARVALAVEDSHDCSRKTAATNAAMAINDVLGPTIGVAAITEAVASLPVAAILAACRTHRAAQPSELPVWLNAAG